MFALDIEEAIDYKIIIPVMIYSTGMIFYSKVPSVLIMLISIAFYFYIFIRLKNIHNLISSILIISFIAIPTSTVSVIGTNYGNLPLTWFNISVLLLFFLIGIKGEMSKKYFTSILIFGIFELIQSMFLPSLGNSLKQLLTIILFLFAFIIGAYIKKQAELRLLDELSEYYLIGTISVALQVIIQRSYIMATGHVIGHYAAMGTGRYAYAGLFGDYSFSNLYIASGVLLVFLQYVLKRKNSFLKFILLEIILISSMILVSARTGLFALVIILAIYCIFNFRLLNARLVMILIIVCVGAPTMLSRLLSVRGGQSLLDSSGRVSMYIEAIHYFTNKPIIGYGLGLQNLNQLAGLGAIHNFIIQYLVQMGLVGTMLFLVPLVMFLKDSLRWSMEYKWIFWLVIVGAMLIPDIVSSRFLYGVILLCMISSGCARR